MRMKLIKTPIHGDNPTMTIICLTILTCVGICSALKLGECESSMGMGTFDIPDSDITASSSDLLHNVGPNSARIRAEVNGGAWCPDGPIDSDSYEWLQVELRQLKVINVVETQGRFGRGQGHEFTPEYRLQYQREDGDHWFTYRNRHGKELIQGNSNTYSSEIRELDPLIIARRIRFVPHSNHPKYVCMRVELYGCTWQDGVVSYDTYQGDRRGSGTNLIDYTYDGIIDGRTLRGGLGQLMDGIEGYSNFKQETPNSSGIKGYEWLGWRSDTTHDGRIPLVFKFDAVRNFTRLVIHANNFFSKEVRVFRRAEVLFSVGGIHYPQSTMIEYNYMRDSVLDGARSAIIKLNHRIGQYVKVLLYFDTKWLMISEVSFNSDYAVGNFTLELPPPTTATPTRQSLPVAPPTHSTLGNGGGAYHQDHVINVRPDIGQNADTPMHNIPVLPDQSEPHVVYGNQDNEGAWPDTSQGERPDDMSESVKEVMRSNYGNPDDEGGDSEGSDSEDQSSNPSLRRNGRLQQDQIGIIIGVLLALILVLVAISVFIVILHRRRKINNNHQALKIMQAHNGGTLNLGKQMHQGNLDLGHLTRGSSTLITDSPASTAKDTYDLLTQRKLPDLPPPPETAPPPLVNHYANCSPVTDISAYGTLPCAARSPQFSPSHQVSLSSMGGAGHNATLPHNSTNGLYAVGGVNSCLSATLAGSSPQHQLNSSPSHAHSSASAAIYGTARDALREQACSIQGVSGSNLYAVPNPDLLWREGLDVMDIPANQLKLVEKLGQGQFGEVQLCELGGGWQQQHASDLYAALGQGQGNMMVAVKTLRPDATQEARADFYKEVKMMSQLRDANIVQVLGACSSAPGHVNHLSSPASCGQDGGEVEEGEDVGSLQLRTQGRGDGTWSEEDGQRAGLPVGVVVEYMRHGDLYQFLNQHCLESHYTLRKKHSKILSYGCLVYMATQIASGMKYLESLNVVHRDLAARNCLVGQQYTIKIADFGMSRDLYSSDYYRIEGKALLPIRWMAWESILLGKFSSRSDIWSFGVTLWEILTLGKLQPYGDLSDDDVIDNCTHYFRQDGLEQDLPQPAGCPREIYDLMRECWNRDEAQRPSFREIHMFLQRKNMGYSPYTDRTCSAAVMQGDTHDGVQC